MTEDLKRDITDLINPALENAGYELVDLKLARYGRSSRLQVYIDSQGISGVNIDDCADASRLLEAILERADLFEGKYTLEVSSPGIDRPLTREKDFRKKIGRKIQVEFLDQSRSTLRGELVDVNDSGLTLAVGKSNQPIALSEIKLAKEYI